MKCPVCNGQKHYKNVFGKDGTCQYCLGTGEVEEKKRTNFQRITASPEALAGFINKAEETYERCCKGDICCDFCECQWCGIAGRSELIEWLKQESDTE